MSEILNPLAELDHFDSGKYLTPEEAKGHLGRKFFCPDPKCLDDQRRLIYKVSKNGRPFFCHYPDFQHEISPETLLHKLTIKKFDGLPEFEVPSFKDEQGNYYPAQVIRIDPGKTVMEFRDLLGIRPDVTITSTNGMTLAVEIFVTNKTKEKKIERLNDHRLPTVEINLNDFFVANRNRCKTDIPFINKNASILIAEITRKKWLSSPRSGAIVDLVKGEEPTPVQPQLTSTSPGQGCLLTLLLLPFEMLIFRILDAYKKIFS